MPDMLKNLKVTSVATAQTTAASNYTGASAVDMQDWDGVIFVLTMGTAATDNGIKVQTSSDDAAADAYTDILGSQVLSDATEKTIMIDIYRPLERYLKPHAVRGTSTTLDALIAIQYRGRKLPFNNDSAADNAAETHISPAEGTA